VDLDRFLEKPLPRHLRQISGTVNAFIFTLSVLGGAAALLGIAGSHLAISPRLSIMLGVLAVVMVAVAVYARYYVTHIYDPPFYEITELNGLLTIETANGHRKYVYERRQTVRAIRNNLRLVEFRAHWTGKGAAGSMTVESTKPEHALLDGRRAESDGRVHRWIYPRRPLTRGQPIEVGIRQTHEDDVEIQLPYFREGGGRYKTHRLNVTVTIPLAEHLRDSVRGVIWDTDHSARQSEEIGELTVKPHVDAAAGVATYIVQVANPVLFHSYGIEWTWSRQPTP